MGSISKLLLIDNKNDCRLFAECLDLFKHNIELIAAHSFMHAFEELRANSALPELVIVGSGIVFSEGKNEFRRFLSRGILSNIKVVLLIDTPGSEKYLLENISAPVSCLQRSFNLNEFPQLIEKLDSIFISNPVAINN